MKSGKRIFALILSFVLVSSAVSFVPSKKVEAAVTTSGEFEDENGNKTIWSYDKETKTINISGVGDMLTGEDIGKPNDDWKALGGAEKVVVNEGITSIASSAFYHMQNLETVELSKGVIEIKQYAFSECENLRVVDLPNTLERIDSYAFFNSYVLSDIYIPSSVKSIGSYAFANLFKYFKYVSIPDGIEKIEDNTFENCYNLTKVILPASVTDIGSHAFDNDNSVVIWCSNQDQIDYCELKGLQYVDNINNNTSEFVFTDSAVGFFETKDESVSYTGKEVKTRFAYNGVLLIEGEDYTAVYENNIKVGKAKVVISGIGKYSGEVTKEFNIIGKSIGEIPSISYDVMVDGEFYIRKSTKDSTPQIDFDGKNHKFSIGNIKYGDIDLIEGTDYTVNNSVISGRGAVSVWIKGLGNYSSSRTEELIIIKNPAINIEDANITIYSYDIYNDGPISTPTCSVVYGDVYLYEGEDYYVSYENTSEPGTWTATVSGMGSCVGTKKVEYSIKKSFYGMYVDIEQFEYIYTGKPIEPKVIVKDGDKLLTQDVDYKVYYHNNVEANKVEDGGFIDLNYMPYVWIEGMGKYSSDSYVREFSIVKQDIGSIASVSLSDSVYQYDGKEKKPTVFVKKDNKELKENIDYTLEYINSNGVNEAYVNVNGMGLYDGTIQLKYMINPISIDDAEVVLSETTFTYDGSKKDPTVTVTLNGNQLKKDVDYKLSYKNNINPGTAYAVIEGKGVYGGTLEVSFIILEYSSGMDNVYGDNVIYDDELLYDITDDDDLEVEVSAPISKKITSVHIPATVKYDGKTYKVTSIGTKAFYKNTKITSITIGNNVKSIEDYAFYGCKNVTSIKLGKNVEIIGNSSFRKCTKVTSVTLPKKLDVLGKNAFYGCSKLKTITINANTVVDISKDAIKGVSKKCVIKVPKKYVKKYKKEFNNKTGFKKTMKIRKK